MILSKNELRKRALEIDISTNEGKKRLSEIVKRMKGELERNGNLAAICAPLLGEDARVVCLKFAGGDIRTLVNPVIELTEGSRFSREKQLLVSDTEYLIPRFERVQVIYQTPVGKTEENAFDGAAAIAIQQMCDVLNGVLLDEVGLEILEGFDELPDEDKQKIIAMYFKYIEAKHQSASRAVEEDEEAKTIETAVDFSQKYMAGMIETIPLTEDEIESLKKSDES